MPLSGNLLIGAREVRGGGAPLRAFNPATGQTLEPEFRLATFEEVGSACALASAAAVPYRDTSLELRATFLDTIARNIEALGDELILRVCEETGLPRGRIEGERMRTTGQLRLFAATVRSGSFIEARVDGALPDRKPVRRPELRLRHIALGPVVVFSASNFPLAFSVAGGDTAAALAAGCPVIIKGHSAHPGTSELVGRAIQSAVAELGLHEGTFSLLLGDGREIGSILVADCRVKAAAFTGSRSGGLALQRVAQNRPCPIPFHAEMSSINPVLLMPGALRDTASTVATDFVASLTLGNGQFCTNPGLVLAIEGPALQQFLAAARIAIEKVPAAAMLTPSMKSSYATGVARLREHREVDTVAVGGAGTGCHAQAALFATSAGAFQRQSELSQEVFGPAGLIVRCTSLEEMRSVLEKLEGQLTVSVHMNDDDAPAVKQLVPLLEDLAGRILINGFGTGVEVVDAMVHGGPFPATSDSRTTSVGTLAIRRFLRPVAYQDFPPSVLPELLQDLNPFGISRTVDGRLRSPL